MLDKISKPTISVLLTAAIAAMCSCQFDDVAQPVAPRAQPLLAAPEPSTSFVGTLPNARADEEAITPRESVGAASNE
ncbi:MAG TPA: hypothetical protein VJO99_10840 [Burkholderiaceae bacterium]|nr:hypothetical protein [Burkholderiaceae bacterium]